MQFSLFRFHRISGVFINKFLYWASISLKSRALANWAIGAYGAPGRTRTCNLRFRRPLLYPVELLGHFLFIALRWYSSRKNAEQLNRSASIISSSNFYWLIKLWSNKLVFLVFLLLVVFLFICIITFSPFWTIYIKSDSAYGFRRWGADSLMLTHRDLTFIIIQHLYWVVNSFF